MQYYAKLIDTWIDRKYGWHNIKPMDNNNEYTSTDLQSLEQHVTDLIDTVDTLKNENTSLRHQHHQLMTERSQLIEKTELARTRIEAMIGRLKALEIDA